MCCETPSTLFTSCQFRTKVISRNFTEGKNEKHNQEFLTIYVKADPLPSHSHAYLCIYSYVYVKGWGVMFKKMLNLSVSAAKLANDPRVSAVTLPNQRLGLPPLKMNDATTWFHRKKALRKENQSCFQTKDLLPASPHRSHGWLSS